MRLGPGAPYNRVNPTMLGSGFMRQGPSQFGGIPMRSLGSSYRMNPMFGMGQPAKHGGFLANLFGKGNGVGANLGHSANIASGTSGGGGFLKSLMNPGTINGFLNNTQHVLKTAQQIGPMVQQYGPIVKNLPAMWKLYRGFKDLPDQEEEQEQKEEQEQEQVEETPSTEKTPVKKATYAKKRTIKQTQLSDEEPASKIRKGESTPKLFF